MEAKPALLPAAAGAGEKREERTPPMRPTEIFPPELVQLLGTARQEIDQHLNNEGTCTGCGLSWPCQRAQLAEFTLAAA